MGWPTVHAIVNHFPIVLTVIGALGVLLAAMHERRGTWTYALVTLTLAGLTIYPASFTGDRAEHALGKTWYIAPGAIDTHSAAADVTLWIVLVTGLLALIALITLYRSPAATSPAKAFRVLIGLASIVSVSAVGYTGYLGGKVVIESPVLQRATPPMLQVPQTVPAGQPAAGSPSPLTPTTPGSPQPQTALPQTTVPQTQTQVPAPQKP